MTDVAVPGEPDWPAVIRVSSPKPFQGQGYNWDYGTVNVANLATGIAVAVAMQAQDVGLEPQGFYLDVEGDAEAIKAFGGPPPAIEGSDDA